MQNTQNSCLWEFSNEEPTFIFLMKVTDLNQPQHHIVPPTVAVYTDAVLQTQRHNNHNGKKLYTLQWQKQHCQEQQLC